MIDDRLAECLDITRQPGVTDEHRQLRDAIRRFVERELAPHVDAWDEAGEFPRELHRKAADIGLLGLGYPESVGGTPCDTHRDGRAGDRLRARLLRGCARLGARAAHLRRAARRAPGDLCITGEPITAQEALQLGLINRVSDDLDAGVQALLERFLDKSPAAIRRGIYLMKRIGAMSFEESMAFTESQIGLFALTEDAAEGQAAFREKRAPKWSGR